MKSIFQMRMAFLFFVPLCLCALIPFPSRAQTSSVQAAVDTTQTTLDTPIRLSVTLTEGDGEVDVSAIQDFKILSQASSSSVQIINGRMHSERTKTFTLLPLREGRLTIPALRVTVDGKTGVTNPITIQVTRGTASTDTTDSIRVTGTISESQPYIGQQLVYTFRLLYAVQLANTDYEAPSFEGFSAIQIGEQKTDQKQIHDQLFREVTISYLLVPLKTGRLTIGPAQLQCDVVSSKRTSRSQFDSFFNDSFFGTSQLIPKVYRTNTISVDVLPLPAWTGSDVFSGLVGQFDMTADLADHEVTVGDSITLSVTLQGKGNLQDAEPPQFQLPTAFKQYADQPETAVQLKEDGYTGKKVFRTALVPVKEGQYTLTTAPMVYFDPLAKAYRRLAPPSLSVTVKASETPTESPTVFSPLNADSNPPVLQKQKVDFTGRDILSIKSDLDALSNQASLPTPWFLSLLLAPGVLLLSLFGLLRLLKKDDRPAAEMSRKAQTAMKAAVHTRGSDTAGLYSNLYRALLYAVFARAKIFGESLTQGEAETLLKQNGVDTETAAAVSALFGRLESARFGKSVLSRAQQKALVSETNHMVKGLVR